MLGNITALLNKIKPAIERNRTTTERNGNNKIFLQMLPKKNVFITVQKMKEQSSILNEMEKAGEIKIIGGLHDIDSGQVLFFEDLARRD